MTRMAILLLLYGCAGPDMVWRRTGATHQDFLVDKYACAQESRTSWSGGGTGIAGAIARRSARSEAEEESSRLYNMCMEARGWRLVQQRTYKPAAVAVPP